MFEKSEENKIVQAIKDAERQTSGELHVHLASEKASGDVEERALETFNKLKMDKTQERNGVLFYIDYQLNYCKHFLSNWKHFFTSFL